MARPAALHFALDLAAMPALAGAVQNTPLPPGVLDLIKIAAGCAETCARAVSLTGKSDDLIREAATIYLQTALFFPRADSYRVLGVSPDAAQDEIRLHLRWLMKWLHPDRRGSDWQSSLAERVLGAWDELKSPERRGRYDRLHPSVQGATSSRPRRQWRRPWLPWIDRSWRVRRQPRLAYRLVAGIAIGLAVVTIVIGAGWSWRAASAPSHGVTTPSAGAAVHGATTGGGAIVARPRTTGR